MAPLPNRHSLKALHSLIQNNFVTLGHAYKIIHLSPVNKRKVNQQFSEITEDCLEDWFQLYQTDHLEFVNASKKELEERWKAEKREVEAFEAEKIANLKALAEEGEIPGLDGKIQQIDESDENAITHLDGAGVSEMESYGRKIPNRGKSSNIDELDEPSTDSLDSNIFTQDYFEKAYKIINFNTERIKYDEIMKPTGKKLTKAQEKKLKEQFDWELKVYHLLLHHYPEYDAMFLLEFMRKTPNWDDLEFRKWYFNNILMKSFPESENITDILPKLSNTYLKNTFAANKLLAYYDNSILKMLDELHPCNGSFNFHPQDLSVGIVPGMEMEDMATVERKRATAREKNSFKVPTSSWIFSPDFPLKLLRQPEWDTFRVEICARLEKLLKMKYVSEWVRIGKGDLEVLGAARYGSTDSRIDFLKKVHPEVKWNKKMFAPSTKSNQRWVYRTVEEIFPSLTVIEEKQMELDAHGGKSLFEADVFVEELQLAFEYQGEQHYHDIKAFFAPIEGQLRRDQLKSDAFAMHGITLVHVPYWWDKRVESLQATINMIRPDLVECPSNTEPIPVEPVNMPKFSKKAAAMEPSSWNGRKDLTGWYWCEKYDGIRCISQEGKFYSKKGNEIIFPDWYAEKILPYIQDLKYPIDSELTCSQGYELMTTLVRLARNFTFEDREWMKVQLRTFDIVDTSSTLSFEERQAILLNWYNSLPDEPKQFIVPVAYERIISNEHLRIELDRVAEIGGEGLIAVAPNNIYQPGRSRDSLKIKKYFDMEGLYLGKSPNAIAFEVELLNGERCQARTSYSDYARNTYVPRKTVLTLTYTHLHQSTGKPFKPMVLRERLDLTWGEIKDHYSRVQPDYIELHSIARTPPSLDQIIAQSRYVNSAKELLQKLDKPASGMSDEEIRSLIGEMMRRDGSGQYPTMDEKKGLAELLSVPEGLLNQMIADARYHETPDSKVLDAKRRIEELMQSQNSPPTREQLIKISELTDITTYRLGLIVNELQDPPGNVTEEKKNIIWKFIKTGKSFEVVSLQDLLMLKEKTQLNLSQVRRIIWFMKDRPGILNEAKKAVVREFVQVNRNREPTDEEVAQLADETALNRMQILNLIHSFNRL